MLVCPDNIIVYHPTHDTTHGLRQMVLTTEYLTCIKTNGTKGWQSCANQFTQIKKGLVKKLSPFLQDPKLTKQLVIGFIYYATQLCIATGNKVRIKEFGCKMPYNEVLKAQSTQDVKDCLKRLEALPKPSLMTVPEAKSKHSPPPFLPASKMV